MEQSDNTSIVVQDEPAVGNTSTKKRKRQEPAGKKPSLKRQQPLSTIIEERDAFGLKLATQVIQNVMDLYNLI